MSATGAVRTDRSAQASNGTQLSRRAVLLSTLIAACGGQAPTPKTPAPAASFQLEPLSRLLVAPRLEWMLEAKPRTMHVELLSALLSEARFDLFKARFGFDLRAAEEAVFASYQHGRIWGARAFVSPSAIETSFVQRAETVARRSTKKDLMSVQAVAHGAPTRVTCFGTGAVLFEEGNTNGAYEAALLLAQAQLKRTRSALSVPPLDRLSQLLGDADLRAMAPGPFPDNWVHAASDLLVGATAVGLSIRVVGRRLACALCLTGVADSDPDGAKARALATFDRLVNSDVGHIAGLDHTEVKARTERDVLWIEFSYDAGRLAEGLHRLLEGSAEELLQRD